MQKHAKDEKKETKNSVSVGILGGGAAGMMAAITAAKAGADVTILESGERLGQKILSTGNGRCNLGNEALDAGKYYGSCTFLPHCFQRFGTKDTISFFHDLGLLIKEKNGYLYPRSEQASAVLDVLRFEIAALGIKVIHGFCGKELYRAKDGKWTVRGKDGEMCFERVILTCGGKAMPKTGSDGSGYEIAKKMGHTIVPVVPGLTSLKCKEDFFKAITGVRTDGRVDVLNVNGKSLCSDKGEIQLTDQGISGIPVFQVSREVAYELKKRKEVSVKIDFLPELGDEELSVLARERFNLRRGRTIEECMTGILSKKITALLIKRRGLKGTDPAGKLKQDDILAMLTDAKAFMVTAFEVGNFQNCQVCAGGVSCAEIKENMESKLARNIFFAGEILDVDGKCGGYNLQWAWTSGYLAGRAAAEGDSK